MENAKEVLGDKKSKVAFLEFDVMNAKNLSELTIIFKEGRAVAMEQKSVKGVVTPVFIDVKGQPEKLLIIKLD